MISSSGNNISKYANHEEPSNSLKNEITLLIVEHKIENIPIESLDLRQEFIMR